MIVSTLSWLLVYLRKYKPAGCQLRSKFLANVIFIFFLPISSCHKPAHTPCDPAIYDLSQFGFVNTPYTDSSIISFLNIATSDTVTFFNLSYDSSFITERYFTGDCGRDNLLLQIERKFICPISSDSIRIKYSVTTKGPDEFYIFFNQTEYSMLMQYPYHFDSTLIVQNKTYTKVAKFYAFLHPQSNPNRCCYLNSDFGILKLETKNGVLELLNFKK